MTISTGIVLEREGHLSTQCDPFVGGLLDQLIEFIRAPIKRDRDYPLFLPPQSWGADEFVALEHLLEQGRRNRIQHLVGAWSSRSGLRLRRARRLRSSGNGERTDAEREEDHSGNPNNIHVGSPELRRKM